MDPVLMKFMMYFLPILTVSFTWWLPAALQLSFFISGLLSFGQATLFQQPAFRRAVNMYPLPTAAAPAKDGKPSTPYKGSMMTRTQPLTQAQIREAHQITTKPKPTNPLLKEAMGTFKEMKNAADGVVGKMKDRTEASSERKAREAAEAYEKKRQAELKKEQLEREHQRRAKRAARKLNEEE